MTGKNSCATPMMTHQRHGVHPYSVSPLAATPAAQSSHPRHLSRCGAAAVSSSSCTPLSSTISPPSSSSSSQGIYKKVLVTHKMEKSSSSSPRLTLKFQHIKRRENSSKSGMSTSAGSATTTTTTKPLATASDVTCTSTVGGGKFTPLDAKASASINNHHVIASYGSTKNEYDAPMISPIIRGASNCDIYSRTLTTTSNQASSDNKSSSVSCCIKTDGWNNSSRTFGGGIATSKNVDLSDGGNGKVTPNNRCGTPSAMPIKDQREIEPSTGNGGSATQSIATSVSTGSGSISCQASPRPFTPQFEDISDAEDERPENDIDQTQLSSAMFAHIPAAATQLQYRNSSAPVNNGGGSIYFDGNSGIVQVPEAARMAGLSWSGIGGGYRFTHVVTTTASAQYSPFLTVGTGINVGGGHFSTSLPSTGGLGTSGHYQPSVPSGSQFPSTAVMATTIGAGRPYPPPISVTLCGSGSQFPSSLGGSIGGAALSSSTRTGYGSVRGCLIPRWPVLNQPIKQLEPITVDTSLMARPYTVEKTVDGSVEYRPGRVANLLLSSSSVLPASSSLRAGFINGSYHSDIKFPIKKEVISPHSGLEMNPTAGINASAEYAVALPPAEKKSPIVPEHDREKRQPTAIKTEFGKSFVDGTQSPAVVKMEISSPNKVCDSPATESRVESNQAINQKDMKLSCNENWHQDANPNVTKTDTLHSQALLEMNLTIIQKEETLIKEEDDDISPHENKFDAKLETAVHDSKLEQSGLKMDGLGVKSVKDSDLTKSLPANRLPVESRSGVTQEESRSLTPKVPPLKIIIPPKKAASASDKDAQNSAKMSTSKSSLPYVLGGCQCSPTSQQCAACMHQERDAAPSDGSGVDESQKVDAEQEMKDASHDEAAQYELIMTRRRKLKHFGKVFIYCILL